MSHAAGVPSARDAANARMRSRLARIAFESELEDCVKHCEPREFAVALTARLKEVEEHPNRIGRWPPHNVLTAIEANCCYRRGHCNRAVDERLLRKAMNLFAGFYDPYHQHLLQVEHDLGMFMQLLHRQQLAVQERPSTVDLGRCLLLYAHAPAMRAADEAFERHIGISLLGWIRSGFVIAAHSITTGARPFPVSELDHWMRVGYLSSGSIGVYLEESGRTPEEVREQYLADRAAIEQPHLHACIPTGFLAYPLLRLERDEVLAPLPNLVLRRCYEGLHHVGVERIGKTFTAGLSQSFYEYVKKLLEESPRVVARIGDSELEQMCPRRACDLAIETDREILLVECKATRMNSRILATGPLQKDTAIGKVREGIDQLVETAEAIRGGLLSARLRNPNLPIVGLVVTLGEIPFANSRSLRRRILEYDSWNFPRTHPMDLDPQIFTVKCLEALVAVEQESGDGWLEILRTKDPDNYLADGDWDVFLARRVTSKSSFELDPLIGAWEQFVGEAERYGAMEPDNPLR